MNFAFPALLAFLLLLPGIILRYTYARGAWGWASPTSLRRISDELAFGVIFSIPLHVCWLALATVLGWNPDVRVPLALLAGNFGPNNYLLEPTLAGISDNYVAVAGYLVSLFAAAAVLGNLGHRSVRRLRLDHRTKTFRFDNYWYYMLTGEVLRFREHDTDIEEPDGVYASAVVTHSSESYLYRGIVSDFTFDAEGALDTVVLTDAHRRKLADDRPMADQTAPYQEDPRYYTIRGDYLILSYSEMQTLNLDYFWLGDLNAAAEEPDGSGSRPSASGAAGGLVL
jgi:hypothetical protein